MTIQYITNENGDVVAQFDGRKRDLKDGHKSHIVDSVEDLPGISEWDEDYIDQ